MELILLFFLILILPILAIKFLIVVIGSMWQYAGSIALVLFLLLVYSCSQAIT